MIEMNIDWMLTFYKDCKYLLLKVMGQGVSWKLDEVWLILSGLLMLLLVGWGLYLRLDLTPAPGQGNPVSRVPHIFFPWS